MDPHHVAVIGAGAAGVRIGAELLATGITDFVLVERGPGGSVPPALRGRLRPNRDVVCLVFDDDADAWTLQTRDGEVCHARIVIAAHRPSYLPWIPDLSGRSDFHGPSFHAAAWDHDFDPAGKRIAVIGVDATAANRLAELTAAAASVVVFAHPPRRVIPQLPPPGSRARRWLRGQLLGGRRTAGARRHRPIQLVSTPIAAVTASGIRTREGAHHDVDAIVYGTGFTIPEEITGPTLVGARGVTLRRAWYDGMEPYRGVAVHGFPNYFLLGGPDTEAQTRYIVGCLALMNRAGATRIEVRRSVQQVFNERVRLRSGRLHVVPSAFDLSCHASDDTVYDGTATLTIATVSRHVHVRLSGYLDPIDGQFHWRGMVLESLPAELLGKARTVTLSVGERSAPARITEQTPWGGHSIVGVGAPPYGVRVPANGAPAQCP